jgi:hypothetical protein
VAGAQQQDTQRTDLLGRQPRVCLPLQEQTHQIVAGPAPPPPLLQKIEEVALLVD